MTDIILAKSNYSNSHCLFNLSSSGHEWYDPYFNDLLSKLWQLSCRSHIILAVKSKHQKFFCFQPFLLKNYIFAALKSKYWIKLKLHCGLIWRKDLLHQFPPPPALSSQQRKLNFNRKQNGDILSRDYLNLSELAWILSSQQYLKYCVSKCHTWFELFYQLEQLSFNVNIWIQLPIQIWEIVLLGIDFRPDFCATCECLYLCSGRIIFLHIIFWSGCVVRFKNFSDKIKPLAWIFLHLPQPQHHQRNKIDAKWKYIFEALGKHLKVCKFLCLVIISSWPFPPILLQIDQRLLSFQLVLVLPHFLFIVLSEYCFSSVLYVNFSHVVNKILCTTSNKYFINEENISINCVRGYLASTRLT